MDYLTHLQDATARMQAFIDTGRWTEAPWAEGALTRLFLDRLASATHVIDIGAEVGFYTALALKYGKAMITAFEADPVRVSVLQAHFAGNPRVRLIGAAVADRAGVLTCSRSDNPAYPCATLAALPGAVTFTCSTVTLDEAVTPRLNTLIKMDIEGAEVLALRGMRTWLQRHPDLCFEIHPDLIDNLVHGGLREIETTLRAAGYRIANCDHAAPMPTAALVGSRLYASTAPAVPATLASSARIAGLRAKRLVREQVRGY